jgi:uncharacterized membrane protein YfhO
MYEAKDFHDLAWIEVPGNRPALIRNGSGTVTARRRGTGYELQANMQSAGWVVISESAWNGWRAYVDGRPVKPHYANHAFLGVHVPAGNHQVRLRYLPVAFTRGRNVTSATIVMLLVLGLWRWRSQKS